MRSDRKVALGLISLLLWPSFLFAEQQGPVTSGEGLKIIVVRGEGSKNNIRTKSAEELVVKVVDTSDKPVPGAEVVFQAPANGPSGRFYDWLQMQTVKADSDGLAKAQGFAPNDELGRWHMRVLAQSGSKNGTALVPQVNISGGTAVSNGGNSRKKLWIALGVAGVAAIAGGVAASRGGNGTSAATVVSRPITISPGPITVGGPR